MDGKKYRVDSLSTTYSALHGTSTVEQIMDKPRQVHSVYRKDKQEKRANKQSIMQNARKQ